MAGPSAARTPDLILSATETNVTVSLNRQLLRAHLDEFTDQGFTVIRGVFSASEIERYLAANERVVDKVRNNPRDHSSRYTSRDEGSIDTWGVNGLFSPGLYEAELAAIFDHDPFMTFPRFVLGNHLRFWSANTLWSPEKVDYELYWHKDNFDTHFDTTGSARHVQFNICLTPDTSFKIVPGTHRRPLDEDEAYQVKNGLTGPLPSAVSVDCNAGDVIYMNYLAIHRGSCKAGVFRRTLHMVIQSMAEQTGGQTSFTYMREPGYLNGLQPGLRELMTNAIKWDDSHPIDRAEARRRLRISHDVRRHNATVHKDDEPKQAALL
jgi:hypothetical protein